MVANYLKSEKPYLPRFFREEGRRGAPGLVIATIMIPALGACIDSVLPFPDFLQLR